MKIQWYEPDKGFRVGGPVQAEWREGLSKGGSWLLILQIKCRYISVSGAVTSYGWNICRISEIPMPMAHMIEDNMIALVEARLS